MRRLPLRDIEAFVAVARAGSLAQAALTMNLSVPALSRRIQQLEAGLAVRLFERQPRGLALTAAGDKYFAALDPAWRSMTLATEALRKRDHAGLTVSVMPTFAANWLIPRLQRFLARHSAVQIVLQTSAEIEDLNARSELDCAIRLGRGPWPGVTSEPLLAVDAVPVLSPQLRDRYDSPRHPHDLVNARLIGTDHQIEFWAEWFAASGIDAVPTDCLVFDNLQVVYEAASAGMGIALGLDPVVRPFIDAGRLVPLFAERVRLPRQFHLVRRRDAGGKARDFAVFRDWLFAEAARFAA
ncbi:LysR family transcriptional regulator [Bradyrhizobium sp. 83012]|uniref:LysR family transcriptional regulator n=1 Tax=Bradyrhizobium aeschynomenes TaxID=2734909 RepID=A0ABX2CGB8_9BRAD|nr:LysR substrate-binding domain-containing protein [Bradyrhizobium aeschynomenes]NPU67244.1 LysR family transcriptional regulator [Bradyrhizobium aeschynomenes]